MQVYSAGLTVLAGTSRVQDFGLPQLAGSSAARGLRIVVARISDPFVALHLSDGSVVLLSADPENGTEHLVLEMLYLLVLNVGSAPSEGM